MKWEKWGRMRQEIEAEPGSAENDTSGLYPENGGNLLMVLFGE